MSHTEATAIPRFLAGFWRLADPKISLASMASIFLGACAAARDGPIAWGWLGLTLTATLAIEVAKNASGEVADWKSGVDQAVSDADRTPFSGGKRVLVDGLLTPAQTWLIAILFYCIAIGAGLLIVFGREPRVLWLGIAGMAMAYFYHAPPLRLSYRGLGEVAVGLCYGPGICAGTYLVQRGALPPAVACLGVPLGLLIAAFLWINEFPDYRADRAGGKRTLVVRLGRPRAARLFVLLHVAAFSCLAGLPLIGLPPGVWVGLIAVLPAVGAARRLLAQPEDTPRIVPAQKGSLLAFALLSAGSGAGLLLGG